MFDPELVSSVLVPIDGSPLSLRALPIATTVAERCEADLCLFRAVRSADEVPACDADLAALRVRAGGRPARHVVMTTQAKPGQALGEGRPRMPPEGGGGATAVSRGRNVAGSPGVQTP